MSSEGSGRSSTRVIRVFGVKVAGGSAGKIILGKSQSHLASAVQG